MSDLPFDPDDLPDPIVPSVDDPTAQDPDEPEHNYDAWIGRYVYEDGDPEPVGAVAEIYYDALTQRPEWLVLTDRHVAPIPGSHLGGPYDDIYLGHTKDRVLQSPTAPLDGLDAQQEHDLYAYYGLDWDSPPPDPLPPRFDDGWDTNWDAAPQPRGTSTRMRPFEPVVTPPPPAPG